MSIDIPPKKKYATNYLKQVICQLTFARNSSISEDKLKVYKQSLGENYTELSSVAQHGIVVEADGSAIKARTDETTLWQIESADKTHRIVISYESLSIVYSQYVKYRDFIGYVEKAQQLFTKQFLVEQYNRVGLRYVNQIAPEKLDKGWQEYISSELIGSLNFVAANKLRRSMHTMQIQHDDETRVQFNYGIFNEYFPSPIVKNEFILDIDAFNDEPHDINECRNLIERFNTTIAIYFERSITDALREKMGRLNHAAKK